MRVFDIGFYDGSDTGYYLWKGADVVAFEANPVYAKAGAKRFSRQIAAGQLILIASGVGVTDGVVEFYLNRENAEWSTFYREAALNWGETAYDVIRAPCISPTRLFAEYGVPDYLKVDIEGYDIFIAQELRRLPKVPDLASFEASNRGLLRELVLAGYDSFKLVNQAKVPAQTDVGETSTYRFTVSNTGQFGDAAPGEWLSFENAMYLYLRFEGDMFGTSVPSGSWWDVHAAIGSQAEMPRQLEYLRRFIDLEYGGHCGLWGEGKPRCPARDAERILGSLNVPDQEGLGLKAADRIEGENRRLGGELDALYASTSWRVTAPIRALRRALLRATGAS
jgi:FkbM family methyltransferase